MRTSGSSREAVAVASEEAAQVIDQHCVGALCVCGQSEHASRAMQVDLSGVATAPVTADQKCWLQLICRQVIRAVAFAQGLAQGALQLTGKRELVSVRAAIGDLLDKTRHAVAVVGAVLGQLQAVGGVADAYAHVDGLLALLNGYLCNYGNALGIAQRVGEGAVERDLRLQPDKPGSGEG
jgi:hypothetical protein